MAVDTDDEEVLVEPDDDVSLDQTLLTSSVVVTDNTGEQSRVTTTVNADAGMSLLNIGDALMAKVNVAVNRAVTPATTTTRQPVLEEFQVNGMKNNQKVSITAVRVGRHTIEKNTAYDFLAMRKDAAKEGVILNIRSAFRSFEEQSRLYAERVNPDGTLTPTGKVKGRAAKPGSGPHQRGIALDIHVNMTVKQLADNEYSPAFIWLTANAARYGFQRTVPTEPWHWEHPDAQLVATITEEDLVLSLVSAEASGAAAIQSRKSDAAHFLDKNVHDLTKAQERAVQMSRTGRQLLYATMGRDAVFRGASLIGKASRYQQRTNTATVQQPEYAENSLKVTTFDFTTGLWGDGRPV